MTLNYDTLPASVRRAVDAAEGKPARRARSSRQAPGAKNGHWRCATADCRAEFTHLDRVDEHVAATAHCRTEVVLDNRR